MHHVLPCFISSLFSWGFFCDVKEQYVPMDQARQDQVAGRALQTAL